MSKGKRLPLWRVGLIFGVALLLLGVIVWEVVKPLRQRLASRYVNRGDSYMLSLQFADAEREYEKALELYKNQETAQAHLELAKRAPVDIALTRTFFAEHNAASVVTKIDQAKTEYNDPKEALKAGVSFFDVQDFAYARYPLERAVELDPGYPEAWHYLMLTYEKLAEFDAAFRAKAEDAKTKRDSLTPKYLKGTAW